MLLVFDGLDQFGEGMGSNHHSHHSHSHRGNHYGAQQHHHNRHWVPEHRKQALSEMEIQDSIQSFLQNVFEKCSIDTKVLVTSSKKLHYFADFTNCISRYYMLRKLKPKDAAKLFSRSCNQFRHTDIVSNHELMRILEYNPKQILKIVQLKHRHHLDSLDKIVKAFMTQKDFASKHEQQEKREREQKEEQMQQEKREREQKEENQQHGHSNRSHMNGRDSNGGWYGPFGNHSVPLTVQQEQQRRKEKQ